MSTERTDSTVRVTPTGCCPPFVSEPWEDKEVRWLGKPFVKDHVTCLFHVPLNMGRKITKDMALIEAAHAQGDANLMLADVKSGGRAGLAPTTRSTRRSCGPPHRNNF